MDTMHTIPLIDVDGKTVRGNCTVCNDDGDWLVENDARTIEYVYPITGVRLAACVHCGEPIKFFEESASTGQTGLITVDGKVGLWLNMGYMPAASGWTNVCPVRAGGHEPRK